METLQAPWTISQYVLSEPLMFCSELNDLQTVANTGIISIRSETRKHFLKNFSLKSCNIGFLSCNIVTGLQRNRAYICKSLCQHDTILKAG